MLGALFFFAFMSVLFCSVLALFLFFFMFPSRSHNHLIFAVCHQQIPFEFSEGGDNEPMDLDAISDEEEEEKEGAISSKKRKAKKALASSSGASIFADADEFAQMLERSGESDVDPKQVLPCFSIGLDCCLLWCAVICVVCRTDLAVRSTQARWERQKERGPRKSGKRGGSSSRGRPSKRARRH